MSAVTSSIATASTSRPSRCGDSLSPKSQIKLGQCDDNYRRLIRFEVDRTQVLFDEGEELLPMLHPSVRKHIALFGTGGQAILAAIRRQNYDTLSRRPSLSRWQKSRLMLSALGAYLAQLFAGSGGRS